jgi:hypothetical protein
MADTGLFYWNEKLGKTNPRELVLVWNITGAKTVTNVPVGAPTYPVFDAISSQSTINDFLGTTNEFTTAQFDSTSMGNDAFGGLVNMQGQVQSVLYFTAQCYSSTGGSTQVTRESLNNGLADSTLETAVGLGSQGNLAFKVDFGNTPDFDGLTSGTIVVKIYWISK